MSIQDKIANDRGMGHNISPGVEEVLLDLDKRLTALEPKKAEAAKPSSFGQSVAGSTSGTSIFAPPKAS